MPHRPPAAPPRLAALRAELSGLDEDLLALLARRTSLSREIGQEKQRLGRGTRDFGREKTVLAAARQGAVRHGLQPALVEQIVLLLIQASLSAQEQDRVASQDRGAGQRALVIGGAGKMGRWFVTYLSALGFEVRIADPAGPLADAPHVQHVADWQDLSLDDDVIVVAAPLRKTGDILSTWAQQVQAGQRPVPPGLVFDVGSLKSPLAEGLHAMRDLGAQITSVHPMFGPGTSLLSGKHVVFCDVGCATATASARALFDETMAEQVQTDLDTHDRLISVVLGLSHAVNIAFNDALAHLGSELPSLAGISSATYADQLSVSARVASESPELYFEIQALNPHGSRSLLALADAVQRLQDAVAQDSPDAFAAQMLRGRTHLASAMSTGPNDEADAAERSS